MRSQDFISVIQFHIFLRNQKKKTVGIRKKTNKNKNLSNFKFVIIVSQKLSK